MQLNQTIPIRNRSPYGGPRNVSPPIPTRKTSPRPPMAMVGPPQPVRGNYGPPIPPPPRVLPPPQGGPMPLRGPPSGVIRGHGHVLSSNDRLELDFGKRLQQESEIHIKNIQSYKERIFLLKQENHHIKDLQKKLINVGNEWSEQLSEVSHHKFHYVENQPKEWIQDIEKDTDRDMARIKQLQEAIESYKLINKELYEKNTETERYIFRQKNPLEKDQLIYRAQEHVLPLGPQEYLTRLPPPPIRQVLPPFKPLQQSQPTLVPKQQIERVHPLDDKEIENAVEKEKEKYLIMPERQFTYKDPRQNVPRGQDPLSKENEKPYSDIQPREYPYVPDQRLQQEQNSRQYAKYCPGGLTYDDI